MADARHHGLAAAQMSSGISQESSNDCPLEFSICCTHNLSLGSRRFKKTNLLSSPSNHYVSAISTNIFHMLEGEQAGIIYGLGPGPGALRATYYCRVVPHQVRPRS